MVRVPLLFRGVAVLLLAASTVLGQTPEPPAELALDPLVPETDLLRQFATDTHHPLLALMVDGELAALDAAPPKESSKIKPTPQSPSKSAATGPLDGCLPDGGTLDGGLLDCCPLATTCPTVPNLLPFACSPPPPPPCWCRKCQRQRKHCCGHCCGSGNPYLGWPCCPAWCFYGAPLTPCCQKKCGRRCHHCCGCGHGGHGYPYGGGYGGGWGMGCCGFLDGGFCGGCAPYQAPPPPPPPPPCWCRKCQRKLGCSYGYGYAGCGYPGWPAYPAPGAMMADGCNSFDGPYGCDCCGCGKHRCRRGLFQRCHCCQPPPYPYWAYPVMPCMDTGSFCADCGSDGGFDGGFAFDPLLSGTIN